MSVFDYCSHIHCDNVHALYLKNIIQRNVLMNGGVL
jgi:hypothetical protein